MLSKPDPFHKILQHERFQSVMMGVQTGVMFEQTRLIGTMTNQLHQINAEMNEARQASENALAMQQHMLEQEQWQQHLEEFIYSLQKMVDSFNDSACEVPLPIRYFSLGTVFETVDDQGIGTPIIRGRDNKAAFDKALSEAKKLFSSLGKEKEVEEALEWALTEKARVVKQAAEEELKRSEERQKHVAENRRRFAEQQSVRAARTAELTAKIAELRAKRVKGDMLEFHRRRVDAFVQKQPPFEKVPLVSFLQDSKYELLDWWLILFGFNIVLFWEKFQFEKPNVVLNQQIAEIERELANLDILLVRGARLDEFPDVEVGRLVESFLANSTWTTGTAATGQSVVKCTGRAMYNGQEVTGSVQFVIYEDRFTLNSLEANGTPTPFVEVELYRKMYDLFKQNGG